MSAKSLYFIPDISGFTSFVKSVEVEHSQHIISELLELIIDADDLKLSIAEVEGDAVFFYKPDVVPNSDDILRQVQKTYIRFHEHLKFYETRRICDCGACTTAVNLSLKFVVHEAPTSMITVKGKEKPFGEDVIRVHRLLKNSIPSKEYLLYTDNLLDGADLIQNDQQWSKSEDGEDEYEGLGLVSYKSIGLAFLKKLITVPSPLNYDNLRNEPFHYSMDIKAAKSRVFELITNMNERHKWNKEASEFKYKKGVVNQVGFKHICIIGDRSIGFETVSNDFGPDKLVYGEKTNQLPLIKEGITYFILEGDETQTKLRIEYHYKRLPIIGWLIKLLFIGRIESGLQESLKLIKEIAEAEG